MREITIKKCIRCNNENFTSLIEHRFHTIFKCDSCNHLSPIRIDECCRNPFLNVTIDNKNQDRLRLHRQCQNCGGCIDRTSPLSHKKYASQIRFEFSYLNYENWKNEQNDELRMLWDCVREDNFNSSRFGKYSNYINSEKWKLKRLEVLERDKNLCQKCKNNTAEEVHHKTYENLFNENLEDLLALCKICHIEIHKEIDEMQRIELRKRIENQPKKI